MSSVLSQAAAAQSAADRINRLLERYHEYRLFNGSVLVEKEGEVILKRGFGEANRAWHIPNAPNTKFRIGSTTKQFTAALVLTLMEDGEIDLYAPISNYLPDYPRPQGDLVTVHHLLSHTSGIPNYTSIPGFMSDQVRDPYELDSLVALFSGLDLAFEPGGQWSYSNSGYILLGAIIEAVTGKRYEDTLRDRILQPLGLTETGYAHYEEVLDREASGYLKGYDGYQRAPYLDTTVPYSAGMLYSTVEDLHIWGRSFDQNGPFRRMETKQLMLSPHAGLPAPMVASAGLPPAYGYGVFVGNVSVGGDSVRVVEHGGRIFGFTTGFWRMPDEQNMVILLDNTSSSSVREIGRGIVAILYGKEPSRPRRPISDVLYHIIESEGPSAAQSTIDKAKADKPHEYDFSEVHLNGLGDYYLKRGEVDAAIAVFEINAEANSTSPDAYDSLAEAYFKAGYRARALESYRRALELSPSRPGVARMIEMLESGE